METNLEQQSSPGIIKIVLFGPESTGKTTLAKQLAQHYNSTWVPEYMRSYFEKKWQGKPGKSSVDDLLPIAKGQMELENRQTLKAHQFLFCDTDLLELKVYAERYFNGFCPPEIEHYAYKNRYDFYFLTYIDTPWEADLLRDKPYEREEMFAAFEHALKKAKRPYKILKGNQQQRLQNAIEVIDKWK